MYIKYNTNTRITTEWKGALHSRVFSDELKDDIQE